MAMMIMEWISFANVSQIAWGRAQANLTWNSQTITRTHDDSNGSAPDKRQRIPT